MEEIQSWHKVPKIAHFCSLFKDALDLPDFDIEELEDSLIAEEGEGNVLLLELICKLLNGCYGRTDIGTENYDLYLKDIFNYRLEVELKEKNPLKNSTFFQLSRWEKLQVIDHLCHFRLDAEDVPIRLKGLSGDCMRVEPLGVDAKGATYWYFYGTRLYKEDPQPIVEETKKKTKGKKKAKKTKKGKGKQLEDESSDEEPLAPLPTKQEEEEPDEGQPETPAVKKAARLRVNLEKKEDDDDDAGDEEEEIDLNLQDDVESLKLDLSSEDDDEALFRDHSSDEDYSTKGSKKHKSGKKKKGNVTKTPKVSKTPAAKSSHVPQILRVTPKSARLRAKFGYADEDSRVSNISDDRQSSSSRSTTESRKMKNRKKWKKRLDALEANELDQDASEKMDTDTLENESIEPEDEDGGKIKESTEEECPETQQVEDKNSDAPDAEASVDGTPEQFSKATPESTAARDTDSDTAATRNLLTCEADQQEADMDEDQCPQETQMSVSDQHDEEEEDMETEAQKAACSLEDDGEIVDVEEHSFHSSDPITRGSETKEGSKEVKSDQKEPSNTGTDFIKQEAVDEDDVTPAQINGSCNIDHCQEAEKEETEASKKLSFILKTEDSHDKNLEQKMDNNNEEPDFKFTKEMAKRMIRWPRVEKEDTDSRDSRLSAASSKGERALKMWEPRQETVASLKTGWHLLCEVTEDWQHVVNLLGENGNRRQQALVRLLRENFLPEIPAIQEEKEKERKRRELEMAPRRLSTRLLYKKKEQEDRERILKEAQLEEEKLKAEEEEERRRRMEERKQEEQRRQREERERAREERAKRVKLREERAKLISEGKEIPPELMNGVKNDGPAPEEQTLDEEVVAKLHKVLAVCFKHEEAWPFVESVEEKIAPGYFDLIKMPMNLTEMEEKLKNGRYRSQEDFVSDMDLIVDNCESYNGTDHDFSIMARNLRTAFQQALRRFFPAGRTRKDDDDYVLEGHGGVQNIGRRYKARREASKKALDSFQNILSDADEVAHPSDNKVTFRPIGSGSLRNQTRTFEGYVSGRSSLTTSSTASPGTRVMNSMLNSGKQVIVVSQAPQVVCRQGSQVIEVRTIQPSTPAQAGKSGVQKVMVGSHTSGTPATGMLTAILNSPAGDGSTPKIRYVIPSSMVSLLKDRKPGEEGSRPVYVSISRPQGSQPTTTVTNSSNLTSVLSTIHQSGGTVKLGKTDMITELVGAQGGKSLLKSVPLSTGPTVAGGSTSVLAGSSPLLVGGKRLIQVPGTKQYILAGNNPISVLGNNPSGNIQLVTLSGNGQVGEAGKNTVVVPAGTVQTAEAGNSPSVVLGTSVPAAAAAASSSSSEEPKPAPSTMHFTKETYLRLLAEKKIKIVQQGGKPCIQLQPGVQLVQKAAATTLPQGSAIATTSLPTTVRAPGAVVATGSTAVSTPMYINLGLAASPKPVMISAARPTLVKKPVVVNPWSVNDKVTVTTASPLSVSSVLAPSAVSMQLSSTTSALPCTTSATFTPIAPVMVAQQVTTTFASGREKAAPTYAQVVTPSGTQSVTASTIIPVLASPSPGSLLTPGTVVQDRPESHVLKASPEVIMPIQAAHTPTNVSQTSPFGVAQRIVLSSTQVLSPAQRSLFTSSNPGAPVCIVASGVTPPVHPAPLSTSGPTSVLHVQASGNVPVTVTSVSCMSSTPRASVSVLRSATVSSQSIPLSVTVPSVGNVLTPAANPAMETIPTVQTVPQLVSLQGSVCSSSVVPGISPNSQETVLQKTVDSVVLATNPSAHDNLTGSSSVQRQVSVSLPVPVTVTSAAHNIACVPSVKPVIVNQDQSDIPLSVKPKACSATRRASCKSSVNNSSHDQAQSLTLESDQEGAHGRSRRNVVNRDYKAFAGYSSKSANRRSSVSKSAVRTVDIDSPSLNSSQVMDCKTLKTPSLKRSAVDGSDQVPTKVLYLSPDTTLSDSSLEAAHARQTSHLSEQENVNHAEHCQGQHSTADTEQMEVDGVFLPSQLHSPNRVSSVSGRKNVFDSFSSELQCHEADSVELVPKVNSPRPRCNVMVSGSGKSPLKHADHNIFQQLVTSSDSPAEKSPRDSSITD